MPFLTWNTVVYEVTSGEIKKKKKKKEFFMSSVGQNQSLRPDYQTALSNVGWSVLEVYRFFLSEIIASSYFKQRLRKKHLSDSSSLSFIFTYVKLEIKLG